MFQASQEHATGDPVPAARLPALEDQQGRLPVQPRAAPQEVSRDLRVQGQGLSCHQQRGRVILDGDPQEQVGVQAFY